jgi:hypothetical protein
VQLENPLSCAVKGIKRLSQQAIGSHAVYAEGNGFCLGLGPSEVIFFRIWFGLRQALGRRPLQYLIPSNRMNL